MATKATVVGQLPVNVDLVVYQGDDIFVSIAIDQSIVPIDLTTYTAKAEIHSSPGGALVATFDATIADETTVALHLPHDESAKLVANGAWDCQVTDAAGFITTLAYGLVTPLKEVTQ